jgi:hypothetical protein
MGFVVEKFACANEAQDFFSKLKNQVTIEIGYNDNFYTLTTKLPAEMQDSMVCYQLRYSSLQESNQRYAYALITEDGTYQAGVGAIIVKDCGGLLGSVPILVKYSEKNIIGRRIDSLNVTNFIPANITLDFYEESLRPFVEEAFAEKHVTVWSANGWVKILRILRYPLQKPESSSLPNIWRICCTRGVLEIDGDHQKLIMKSKSNDPDPKEMIRTMQEINQTIRQKPSPTSLFYRYPDNRIVHKNLQTYNLIEEQRRSFYAKFD